jgi:hypothetical protein
LICFTTFRRYFYSSSGINEKQNENLDGKVDTIFINT